MTKTTTFSQVIIVIVLLIVTSLSADQPISISGTFTGGFSMLKDIAPTEKADAFDAAINLDFNRQLNDDIHITAGVLGSPGGGKLGFSEDFEVGLAIKHKNFMQNYEIILGAIDLPFGMRGDQLSNNAHIMTGTSIINPLLYIALSQGGTVNTFASVGLHSQLERPWGNLDVAIFNGTQGNSSNSNGKLSIITRYSRSLFPWASTSLSLISSNDLGQSNSLNTKLTGGMLDLHLNYQFSNFHVYYAQLNFDDANETTHDRVDTYLIESQIPLGSFIALIRHDSWIPYQRNHLQNIYNATLPAPGFLTQESRRPDTYVSRQTLGLRNIVSPLLSFCLEAFHEIYKELNKTSYGSLFYTVVNF